MPLIEADGLTKIYQQNVKQPGLRGAVKSLYGFVLPGRAGCFLPRD